MSPQSRRTRGSVHAAAWQQAWDRSVTRLCRCRLNRSVRASGPRAWTRAGSMVQRMTSSRKRPPVRVVTPDPGGPGGRSGQNASLEASGGLMLSSVHYWKQETQLNPKVSAVRVDSSLIDGATNDFFMGRFPVRGKGSGPHWLGAASHACTDKGARPRPGAAITCRRGCHPKHRAPRGSWQTEWIPAE